MFDPATFMDRIRGQGHGTSIGIRYHAHGEAWAELAFDPSDFTGEGAALAFGPLATLLDMACGLSIGVRCGGFRPHATLDLRVDRLRTVRPGRTIVGRGECLRAGEDVAWVRGLAHDGDPADPIALAAGTFATTGQWGDGTRGQLP